jgi:hypothetical protein
VDEMVSEVNEVVGEVRLPLVMFIYTQCEIPIWLVYLSQASHGCEAYQHLSFICTA